MPACAQLDRCITDCGPLCTHRHGGTFKCLKHLLRHKLVHHDNSK